MEYCGVYISSPIKNEMVHLNDNLRDFLGFKWNVIEVKSAGTISGMERVIFSNYPLGFFSDNCIFLNSFFETSRVGNTSFPLLRVLEQKTLSSTLTTTV